MQHALPRGASATSLAESEMTADGPDSHDDHDDDSDASDDDVAEWDPQPGDAPPMAAGVTKLAEGMLEADVREVYHRLLADQVVLCRCLTCARYFTCVTLCCKLILSISPFRAARESYRAFHVTALTLIASTPSEERGVTFLLLVFL